MARSIPVLFILLVTMSLVPPPAHAAVPQPRPLPQAAPGAPAGETSALLTSAALTGTGVLTGSVRIATLLATYFNRDVQEILDLHADEWGFGNIAKALFTAVEAGVPLEQILAMRDADIGWGEIRKELGLPAGMPHQSLGQIVGRGHKGEDWVPPGQAKKGLDGKGNKGKGKP